MITELRLTLSKTSDGLQDYVQLMSDDMLVNVVLVAGRITVRDSRVPSPARPKPKKA